MDLKGINETKFLIKKLSKSDLSAIKGTQNWFLDSLEFPTLSWRSSISRQASGAFKDFFKVIMPSYVCMGERKKFIPTNVSIMTDNTQSNATSGYNQDNVNIGHFRHLNKQMFCLQGQSSWGKIAIMNLLGCLSHGKSQCDTFLGAI